MFKNYFKIAWRNLVKNKPFSFVNSTGLASGLACFISIALYVADELSYDPFNEKAGRIYRIRSDAGIIALLIALITVSSKAIKAVLAIPVKLLRTE